MSKKKIFSNIIVDKWNRLGGHVGNADMINIFKKLNKFMYSEGRWAEACCLRHQPASYKLLRPLWLQQLRKTNNSFVL